MQINLWKVAVLVEKYRFSLYSLSISLGFADYLETVFQFHCS